MASRCCNRNSFPNGFKKIILCFILLLSAFILIEELLQNSSLFFRTFHVPHLSLHLNKRELFLKKGEEFKLRVIGLNRRVDSYSSTDFKVAYVNFNGRVYGSRVGKAFIVVEVDDVILKCRVHVMDLKKKKLSVEVGEKRKIELKGSVGKVKYSSMNESVAKVDKKGNVFAVAQGRTTILVVNKGLTFTCTINVIPSKK